MYLWIPCLKVWVHQLWFKAKGRPFSLSQLCNNSCPVERTLHPNRITMVTQILYIDQPLRCVSVCLSFFHLYLTGLWTVTTFERYRQQIRGFLLYGLWSPRQQWKHWPRLEPAYQRISQEVLKAFLGCCYCCCYSSGCQPASVYRWEQVHLLHLLLLLPFFILQMVIEHTSMRHNW